ncbi:amidase [Thalassospira sp. MA62]|nr:amidase [Thalassospira sp. MA62]
MTSPNQLSLRDAKRAISNGTLTPETLVQSCLDRISEREDDVGAWMHVHSRSDLALPDPHRNGDTGSPLLGLPIGIKDLIDTADMPTGYGSPIYKDHIPAADAACVSIIAGAGGIALGKTVSTEFAYFQPGKTKNPHDLTRTPGGSSSGSAAAVADYHVPAALGTQTAGSIIRPASYCGVVGYKPSNGFLPLTGIRPLAGSLDHLGVLTRTVTDAGFLAAILGRRPDLDIRDCDPDCPPKIGFCQTPQWDHALPATQALMENAVSILTKAGAAISDIRLPASFDDLAATHGLIMDYEVSFTGLSDVINHPDLVSAKFHERFEAGQKIASHDYDRAVGSIIPARLALADAMADCDVLICPSAPGAAPVGLDATGDPVFNRIWTLIGGPCINVPGLVDGDNMPVGLQVIGRFGDDARTLRAADWIARQL